MQAVGGVFPLDVQAPPAPVVIVTAVENSKVFRCARVSPARPVSIRMPVALISSSRTRMPCRPWDDTEASTVTGFSDHVATPFRIES